MSEQQDKEFDAFDALYTDLVNLPKHELEEILRNILPPNELFQRTDGTRFVIRVFGTQIFHLSTILEEAGIPKNDPRSKYFRRLSGELVDPEIVNGLRRIASREETVCRRVGAIRVPIGTRYGWWVPIKATSDFKIKVDELITEYHGYRNEYLVNDYKELREKARKRVIEAAKAAFSDMKQLKRTDQPEDDYVNEGLNVFDDRFPTLDKIKDKVRMELVIKQKRLPPQISQAFLRIREKEQEILEMELDKAKAEARKAGTEAEIITEQLRLEKIQTLIGESKLRAVEDERLIREEMIREAVSEEMSQAQQLVLQIESRLVRLAQEITSKVKSGRKISSATKGSWRQTLRELQVLTPGNPAYEEAIESLSKISEKKSEVSKAEITEASAMVSQALIEIERRSKTTFNAEQLWKLIENGEAERALSKLNALRSQSEDSLTELEALYEIAIQIGATDDEELEGRL